MSGEVRVVDAGALQEPDILWPTSGQLSVSEMRGPRMAQLMTYQSKETLRESFHRFGIAANLDLMRAGDEEQRIHLAQFDKAYLPKEKHLELSATLIGQVQKNWKAKQFTSEAYRRYWHSNVDVMKGNPLKPIPSCLSDTSGLGFCIHGPSLLDRTAMIQALSRFLGPAFEVEGDHPAPKRMWVFPCLVIHFPTERTKKGFLRNFRYSFLAEIGNEHTKPQALAAIEGPDGENIVIALCTLLNVGLIIIDGAGFLDVNGQTPEIFAFLLKLRRHSGIPILFSGTSAFIHSLSFMGNIGSNLFNGEVVRFDVPRSPTIDAETKKPKGEWASKCIWLWRQAFRDEPMPAHFPAWTYMAACARDGWLAQGFHALIKFVISKNGNLLPRNLTNENITNVFSNRLELFEDARNAILQGADLAATEKVDKDTQAGNRLTFIKHLDHMPLTMLSKGAFKTWTDSYMLSRLGRAA
jgi:hypothetical protein